jgi:hypothetical protein
VKPSLLWRHLAGRDRLTSGQHICEVQRERMLFPGDGGRFMVCKLQLEEAR